MPLWETIKGFHPRVVAQDASTVASMAVKRVWGEPKQETAQHGVKSISSDDSENEDEQAQDPPSLQQNASANPPLQDSGSGSTAANVVDSKPTQEQGTPPPQTYGSSSKTTKLSGAQEPQSYKNLFNMKRVGYLLSLLLNGSDDGEDDGPADVVEIKPLTSLKKYGRNLLENVSDDPVVGRENETDRVIEILCQRQKNNPVLVGEPGVGKTAIVEGLAQRLKDKSVPRLDGFAFYELDIGLLTADTKYRGDLEKRITSILDEIRDAPVIVFIDEIHVLLGSQAAAGAAELLKPAMGRGEIRLIGATTLDEYRAHIEKNPAFERRVTRVMVEEPSVEQTIRLLEKIKSKYELFHTVIISKEATRAAAELSARYMKSRFNPDKSIDLIDEACSAKSVSFDAEVSDDKSVIKFKKSKRRYNRLRIEIKNLPDDNDIASVVDAMGGVGPRSKSDVLNQMNELGEEINEYKKRDSIAPLVTLFQNDIKDIVTRKTGIPLRDEKEQLAGMAARLRSRVTGQDEAIESVVSAIIRTRLGFDTGKRPTGCFLFAGPTGVGKTEMAKALSAELFGDESHMVRIDMSEYSSPESVSRLIGAPPGYVGYESGGQLTEPVRRRPFNVVLMDEIEKASPRVLTILLQLMDDGRLTDGQGRTVDFTNTVVILTTNLGHASFYSGQSPDTIRTNVMQALGTHVQPEFLNRLDATILFWPLSHESIRQIAKQAVSSLNVRLAARRISCVADDSAIDWIAQKAYDSKMGARPLQNLINKQIVDRIGQLLMKGELSDGQPVQLTVKDGSLEVIPGEARQDVPMDEDEPPPAVPVARPALPDTMQTETADQDTGVGGALDKTAGVQHNAGQPNADVQHTASAKSPSRKREHDGSEDDRQAKTPKLTGEQPLSVVTGKGTGTAKQTAKRRGNSGRNSNSGKS